MGEIGRFDVSRITPTTTLKSRSRQRQHHQSIQALNRHCRQGRRSRFSVFELGGNAANPTQATHPISRQFQGGNLSLARRSHPHANHLSPAVEVGAHRLADVGANGGQSLGQLRRGDAISGYALVVQPLELLELVGFKSLKFSVDGIDKCL